MLERLQCGRGLPRAGLTLPSKHSLSRLSEYGLPGSHGRKGSLRVPVWQAYLGLSRAPRVKLGFNTWLLQKHTLDRELMEKARAQGRKGMAGF